MHNKQWTHFLQGSVTKWRQDFSQILKYRFSRKFILNFFSPAIFRVLKMTAKNKNCLKKVQKWTSSFFGLGLCVFRCGIEYVNDAKVSIPLSLFDRFQYSCLYELDSLAVVNVRDLGGIKHAFKLLVFPETRLFQCANAPAKEVTNRQILTFGPLDS